MMKKLTKEQAIVVSGYTMRLICNFSDLHLDIERRLGGPVFTHEIPSLKDEIEAAYKDDFIAMLPECCEKQAEIQHPYEG